MSYTFEDLCTRTNGELEAIFTAGATPALADLVGWEFDGFNTLDLTPLLGIRRFQKGFYVGTGDVASEVEGYNVTIKPGSVMDPWWQVEKKGTVHRHSPFRVYPVRSHERDNLHPNAVLINYDTPRNPPFMPGPLRDYLVQPDPDNKDLYLGKAYAAVGPLRIFVSYFVLRRALQPNPAELPYN